MVGRTRRVRVVVFGALVALVMVVAQLVASAVPTATVDGHFTGTGPIGPRSALRLAVTGRGGVPVQGVGAVVLNVTATEASAETYLTVWPTGEPRPATSNLNIAPGTTVPNLVVARVGVDGTVSILNAAGSVHVVVDVLGWFPAGSSVVTVPPVRLADTRAGAVTADGRGARDGAVGPAAVRDVVVAGRGGIPATGVGSVVLNVTAAAATDPTYVTVWPAGSPRPLASNLNPRPGPARANLVVVGVGTGGRVSLYNDAGATELVVDALAWFPAGQGLREVGPARLLDTRAGGGTVDGSTAAGPLGPGADADLPVAGRGGVPSVGVDAVVLNVTAVSAAEPSFVTVWPAGSARPLASNLNPVPGEPAANLVVARLGAGGAVSVHNQAGDTDLVVDVLGWFPTGADFRGVVPARLLDTRPVWGSGAAAAGPDLRFDPAAGPGTLELSWAALVATSWADVGEPVTGHDIELVPAPPGGALRSVAGAATATRLTGLVDGTAYSVRVRARGESTVGPWSAASAAVSPASVPGAPAVPALSRVDDQAGGSLLVAWTAPSWNAEALDGYVLVVYRDDVEWQRVAATGDPLAGSSSQVLRVDNGHDYRVAVQARNKAGTGPLSGLSAPVRSFGAPGQVAAVTATATGADGTVSLSFPLPADNGSPITAYRVVSSSGARLSGPATVVGGVMTGVVTGLTNGTGYRFLVAACNAARCGSYSPWSVDAVPFGPPRPPQLTATTPAGTVVRLTWDAVGTANGRAVEVVEVSVDGGAWEPAGVSGAIELDTGPGASHSLAARTVAGGLRSRTVFIFGVAPSAGP